MLTLWPDAHTAPRHSHYAPTLTLRPDAHTARAAVAQTVASTLFPTWTSFPAVPGRHWEVSLSDDGRWGLLISDPDSRPRARRGGEKRSVSQRGRGARAGVRSGSWGGCSVVLWAPRLTGTPLMTAPHPPTMVSACAPLMTAPPPMVSACPSPWARRALMLIVKGEHRPGVMANLRAGGAAGFPGNGCPIPPGAEVAATSCLPSAAHCMGLGEAVSLPDTQPLTCGLPHPAAHRGPCWCRWVLS